MPAGPAEAIGLAKVLDWAWVGVMALVGVVWRQQRAEHDRLRQRVDQLDQDVRGMASKDDAREIKTLLQESMRQREEQVGALRTDMAEQARRVHDKLDRHISDTGSRFLDVERRLHQQHHGGD